MRTVPQCGMDGVLSQVPINVGDKNYNPLFPYGFGLTTERTDG